jgi:hypothetical protein
MYCGVGGKWLVHVSFTWQMFVVQVVTNLQQTCTHAKVSHLVANLSTSCVRTACPNLSTSLEQAVDNL